MHADLPTMAMMSSVACLTTAAALLWFARGQGVDGLASWSWGLLGYAGALTSVALRGMAPDVVPDVLGNVLLSFTLSMMLAAVCRLQRARARPLAVLGPVVAVTLIAAALAGQPAARVFLVSCVVGGQAAFAAWLAHRRRRLTPGRGYQLIVAGAALAAAVLVARAVGALAGWVTSAPDTVPGPAMAAGFSGMLAAILACSAGFLGMMKERSDERNRRLAMRDTLTGIANRRALLKALEQRRASALRRQAPLTVLMIDIDHFKSVNDRFGHAAGDLVLKQVARTIRARIRTQDSVGRYGGEEFMLLLPDTPESGGVRVAEDLCQRVRALRVDVGRASIGVTLSIGVHCGMGTAPESVDDLIRAADEALYRAKRCGRDRVETVVPDTQPLLAQA